MPRARTTGGHASHPGNRMLQKARFTQVLRATRLLVKVPHSTEYNFCFENVETKALKVLPNDSHGWQGWCGNRPHSGGGASRDSARISSKAGTALRTALRNLTQGPETEDSAVGITGSHSVNTGVCSANDTVQKIRLTRPAAFEALPPPGSSVPAPVPVTSERLNWFRSSELEIHR
ncbi:hypothetical protein H920_11680 [Fukomys damarensis]|uniref:Uncharacterized protein n=1 Tax=Fukomys damarensis TaxID=885580 RepID=A0A091D9G8_FUKDA|nr:hypothetical protein H920_11680 [Fukomys damarensis]